MVRVWDDNVTRFMTETESADQDLTEVVEDSSLRSSLLETQGNPKGTRCPNCFFLGVQTTSYQARAGDEGRTLREFCRLCHFVRTRNT